MINNDFYHDLGKNWYESEGDVVALLRQENRAKLPWVRELIELYHAREDCQILDVGCGGGFLTLALGREGFTCTGVDISEGVIAAARAQDTSGLCRWAVAPAEKLPFADGSFDVVCAMDVLEHVTDFRTVMLEALRVLKPDGTILMHTFNRTWLSWLIAARGVEWFIREAPKHLHDWNLFVKPSEISDVLQERNFGFVDLRGIGPVLWSTAFAELLLTRRVPKRFEFSVGGNLQIGYLAAARLKGNSESDP